MDSSGISEDGNLRDGSLTSTPRKRKRRGRRSKHDKQEVVDFWPTGGSFNQENILAGELQSGEESGEELQEPIALLAEVAQPASGESRMVALQSNGQAHLPANETYPASNVILDQECDPSINENAATTSQVPSKSRKGIRSKIPKHPEMRMGGQEKSTSLALTRLEGFVQRLSRLSPHDNHTEFGFAQKEVLNAQVDYNYCLYYPINKEWRPPPSSDKRDMAKAKSLTKPKQWRAALWRLIEKSIKSGKLENVRDGSLVATEIPLDVSDSVESASHELNRQPDNDNKESNQLKAPRSLESSLGSPSINSEVMMINVSDGTMQDIAGKNEGLHAEEKVGIAPLDYVELNSSLEEGELDDNASKSDTDDVMMTYSNSAALEKELPGPQQLDGAIDLQLKDSVLKVLSPEKLNKQLRYFYVGKQPEDVDLSLPIRCLTCGGLGHDSNNCEALTCSSCRAYNKHITVRCPTKVKCPKCRESGHNESTCPYKLKQVSSDEITCDLCQLDGHVEEDCELMWRTSGRTWVPMTYNVHIQLSCYECGNQGHLGNDCPTRRPGKGFGSSSWSLFRKFDVPLKSEQHYLQDSSRLNWHSKDKRVIEMKIRGRAKNQAPPRAPETLPDQDSFLHPKKVPEPVRKSRIQINAGTSQRLTETPRSISFTSIQQPFRDCGPAQEDHRLANDQAHVRDTDFAHYNHGNPMYDGDYDRPRRRSRSPPQLTRKRDYREDRYRPGPPPPQRGHRTEGPYRPAPSAARHAHSRRRI